MQSTTRALTLLATLLAVAAVCLLVFAQKPPTGITLTQPPDPPPTRPGKPMPAIPPVSFSDPDGQELILEELSVRTAIHGMLSLTELDFRFRNPRAERTEGRFSCTLPANAAISRFAKDVNGQLMEGEVVERLRANQVYEQFLHQMRDPALLEQDQGNRFSARIFPIEANAPVQLVLSYTTLLPLKDGVRTYSLPLRGLPKVNKLSFRAFVTPVPGEEQVGGTKTASSLSGPSNAQRSTAEVISFEETNRAPEHDVVLTWRPTAEAPRHRVLRAGDFYLGAFTAPGGVANSNATSISDWLFYVDTSASSAEGAEHRIRALENVLAGLPAGHRVTVKVFDNEVAQLASGTAAELSRSIAGLLRARLFLGGTDLGGLLRDVARNTAPSRAIVIASDLVPTLGSTDAKAVTEAIGALPKNGTIHALILGSREEQAVAKALVAGRGRIVRVPFTDALDRVASEAANELRRPLGMSLDVADAGAEWIYPTHFDDVRPGDEVIVLGKARVGGDAEPRFVNAPMVAPESSRLQAETFAPLLEREAYRAYLEYLAQREATEPSDAVRRALATEQVRLSIEQRVVIPRTTMLVLESEWDYQRFGIDRRALAAILTIDAGGIGRIDRRGPNVIATPVTQTAAPPPAMTRRERAAQKTAPPPATATPVPEPMPQLVESIDFVAEEGVEGGVVGGVEGGVVGGVVGGVPGGTVGGVATDSSVAQRITVTAEAPVVDTRASRTEEAQSLPVARQPSASIPAPPPPPPAPAPSIPPPPRREEKRTDNAWTTVERPTRLQIAALQSELRENPRDRERYNQLGEMLAIVGDWSALRTLALQWQPYDPENPQVYELLGMADEHLGNEAEAARANASLIEIAPGKTELLQRAGLLLLRTNRARLAETPLRKALEVRPDRVNGYRHLALMLWLDGRYAEAASTLESATRQQFPAWYRDAQRVVREELGYVYRAWIAHEPARRNEIEARARQYAVDLDRTDALRVTLAWETDANDVDLHVVDPRGESCFYANQSTSSGLRLYEDITQGLGPEVIRTERLERGTYHVGVRYFSAGPMGVSRGIVVVMRGDDVEIHPFRLVKGGREIRYVTGVTVK